MLTSEFKKHIRPQLENLVWSWINDTDGRANHYRICLSFKNFMRDAIGLTKLSEALLTELDRIPVSISIKDHEACQAEFVEQVCNVFLVYVDFFDHHDRSVKISLKIRAYEARLKNLLGELTYVAFTSTSAAIHERQVLRAMCSGVINTYGSSNTSVKSRSY